MRYISTRGSGDSRSYEEAILSGFASDGGMYFPHSLIQIDIFSLLRDEAISLNYNALSFKILRLFISIEELSDEELTSILYNASLGFDNSFEQVYTKFAE